MRTRIKQDDTEATPNQPPPAVGGWRTAHGAARELGAERVFEPLADGVRAVPKGAGAAAPRRPDGQFDAESARAAARLRWELERQPDFGDKDVPWLPPSAELAPYEQARRDLLKQRRIEILEMTGGISSGVGAMLRAWSFMHAAAEYYAAKFYAGDATALGPMQRAFKAAATHDAMLRDAAAWEAKARPKHANQLPWRPEGVSRE